MMDNEAYTRCPPTPESSDPESDLKFVNKSPPKRYVDLDSVQHMLNDSSSQDSGNETSHSPSKSSISSIRTKSSIDDNCVVKTSVASAPRPSGKPKFLVGPLAAKKRAGVLKDYEEHMIKNAPPTPSKRNLTDTGPRKSIHDNVKRMKPEKDEFEEALKQHDSREPERRDGNCESCHEWCKLYTPGKLKLCSRCHFWSHPYHLPVNLCIPDTPEPEALSCFFCNQIITKKKPQSMEYKNTEDLSAMGDNKPSNAHEYVKEAPSGNYKQWKFFWNLKVEKQGVNLNVKLGDCVYIKHIKGGGRDLMRVQYLIKDSQNKPWFSGYHLIDTYHATVVGLETTNESIRNQFKNMVMTVGLANGWAPVTSIADFACCLYKKDYQGFQPKMFNKSKIFPIIYNYDWRPNLPKGHVEERWEFIRVSDYPICKNAKFVSKLDKVLPKSGGGSGSVCSSIGVPGSLDTASSSNSPKPGPLCVKSKPGPKSAKFSKPGPKSKKGYVQQESSSDSESD